MPNCLDNRVCPSSPGNSAPACSDLDRLKPSFPAGTEQKLPLSLHVSTAHFVEKCPEQQIKLNAASRSFQCLMGIDQADAS